jgi:uncharacterized membrane protein
MLIPYLLLGMLLEMRSVLVAYKSNGQKRIMDTISNIFFVAVIINVAEAGQYFSKNRYPDIFDVFQRIFDTFLGMLLLNVILLVWFLMRKLKFVLYQKRGKVFNHKRHKGF